MCDVDVWRQSEDPIAGLERVDASANCFNYPGEVHAEDRQLRTEQPRDKPNEQRVGSEHAAISAANRRRMDADQDLACFGFWFRHLQYLQYVR